MIPEATALIQKAKDGEPITTKERRHCIAYCQVKHPEYTNSALAELFKVSERMIRVDKKYLREEKAKLIKEDDPGLVVADIVLSYENQVADIEKSKSKCKIGSRDYLEHCKAIFNMRREMVKALQELGYYPKNLGNMTVEKFVYKSIVNPKDNSVLTRPLNRDEVIDVEFISPKGLPSPAEEDTSTSEQLDN